MQKSLALAGVVVFWFGGAPGWASTNCTPGLPLGDGDDTGITTCNSETEYCETHTALVMSQAMCSILTCHKKQANHAVTGNSSNTPEETCEGAALTTFVAKATKAQGRRGAQCGCIDIAGLTSLIEVSLDAMINSALYCAPGPPIDPGGDDLGTLGTPQEVKAESALGACLCKFSTALIGCHRKAAQDALRGESFDEEGCEAQAATARTNCLSHLESGLAPCNIPPISVLSQTEALLDATNGLIFCSASPSGAFLW
jgi:hypothetical protein